MRGRTPVNTRWIVVMAVLAAVSAVASLWRSGPDATRPTPIPLDLVPPIFTALSAQPFIDTGCTGSPVGSFGTTGKAGVLKIAMNSLSIVDYGANKNAGGGDDVEVAMPGLPADLNFASNVGVNVGAFVSGIPAPAATYEELKGVMDDEFKILCGVTVPAPTLANPTPCGGAATGTWVTKGGPSNLSADGVGGEAFESTLDIAGGQGPQPFSFVLPGDVDPVLPGNQPPPIVEAIANQDNKVNLGFSATGACKLWGIGGGQFKILPAPQGASLE